MLDYDGQIAYHEEQIIKLTLAKLSVNEGDCRVWVGPRKTKEGYGRLNFKGKTHYVYRLAYEFWVGEIPKGYTIDHLCRNTRCIRPDHLEAVTNSENVRRSHIAKGYKVK